MLIFLVGVACIRSESANGIVSKVSPLRRPAFFEAKKRRQKTPFRCEPNNEPKSLYAAPLPDRIVCDTDSVGLRSAARDRL